MKFRSAAKALIRRRSDNKYLILTSSKWEKNPHRSQKPDLPGGLIEDGESITEGLLRELNEEIGVGLEDTQLLLAYASNYVDESEAASTTFLLYFAEVDEIEVKLSWEHESYEWMSADQVVNLTIRDPYPTIFSHFQKVGLLA